MMTYPQYQLSESHWEHENILFFLELFDGSSMNFSAELLEVLVDIFRRFFLLH